MSGIKSDAALRILFEEERYQALLLETGYRKPLASLSIQDIPVIQGTLRNFYVLLRVKAEIDQFLEGLSSLGVLDEVRQHPMLMQPLLMSNKKYQLSKGIPFTHTTL